MTTAKAATTSLWGDAQIPTLVDTYREWQASQKIPVLTGHYVPDLNAVELAPWELTGGLGAFIYLEGSEGTSGAYVCEVPPGKSLKPQRHLYEEVIHVLRGRGATTVWHASGQKRSFEWQEGAVFAIPLNANYQIHNGSSSEPVRFVAVTTAPLLMNYFHSHEFIFDNPFEFRDRFDSRGDFFNEDGKMIGTYHLETNFIPDVRGLKLVTWQTRGGGGSSKQFELAGNTFGSHVAEFATGRYKKAHRHGGGAHILILEGEGYSLMWPEGEPWIKVDWKPGVLLSPPDLWWHQHFNVGDGTARYMAFRWGSAKYRMPKLFQPEDRTGGGKSQIEYEEEDPEVRRLFDAECAQWRARQAR